MDINQNRNINKIVNKNNNIAELKSHSTETNDSKSDIKNIMYCKFESHEETIKQLHLHGQIDKCKMLCSEYAEKCPTVPSICYLSCK